MNAAPILEALVARVAELLGLDATRIDPDAPHSSYGLDSASALMLAAELEDELGVHLADSVAWDHPTLRGLAEYVAAELDRAGSGS